MDSPDVSGYWTATMAHEMKGLYVGWRGIGLASVLVVLLGAGVAMSEGLPQADPAVAELETMADDAVARIQNNAGASDIVEAMKNGAEARPDLTGCLAPVAKAYLDKRKPAEAHDLFVWITGQQPQLVAGAPQAAQSMELEFYIQQCDILLAVRRGATDIAAATRELEARWTGIPLLSDALVRIGVECFEIGATERNEPMLEDGRAILETVANVYAANQKTADRVKFMLAKTSIAIAALAGDLDAADRTYATLKADFAGEKLASAMTDIAMIYHAEGVQAGYRGKDTNGYFLRSASIIENDLDPNFVKRSRMAFVYGTLAGDYEGLGDYGKAAKAYSRACQTDPNGQRYSAYMTARKQCYLKLMSGASGTGADQLRAKFAQLDKPQGVVAASDDIASLGKRAAALRDCGDLAAARELYMAVATSDAANDDGIGARVNLLAFDIAEHVTPTDNLADCNSSEAAFRAAEDAAKKCYSKARLVATSEPNNSAVLFRIAAAAGDVEALYLKPSIDRTPNALFSAGLIYGQELGEYAEGAARFEKAAAEWPGYTGAPLCLYHQVQYVQRMGLAGQCSRDEVRKATEEGYKALITRYPDSRWAPKAAAELGVSMRLFGDAKEAATYLEFAVARLGEAGEKLEAMDDLAIAYKKAGRTDDAIRVWTEWLQTAPADHRERDRISKNLAYLKEKTAAGAKQ